MAFNNVEFDNVENEIRISNFLNILEDYWVKYVPNWTFGRFINYIQHYVVNDLYFYSEKEIIQALNKMFDVEQGGDESDNRRAL